MERNLYRDLARLILTSRNNTKEDGKPRYACRGCGADLGWDRPSGVCSEACLRALQGFPPREEQA